MEDLKEMAQSYMSKMTPEQIKELGKTVSNMSEEEKENILKNFSTQFFKNKP
jgi:flagellar motor switch protein FliG